MATDATPMTGAELWVRAEMLTEPFRCDRDGGCRRNATHYTEIAITENLPLRGDWPPCKPYRMLCARHLDELMSGELHGVSTVVSVCSVTDDGDE